MRRTHRRLTGRREPTSWLRQQVQSVETEVGTVLGGDIFDMLTMGILGDGEDFRCTVLRIRAACSMLILGTSEANDTRSTTLFWGVALIGTDTGLPHPGLPNLTDTQTDWLALGCKAFEPVTTPIGAGVGISMAWDVDVKAKRKVAIGEHIVLAVAFEDQAPFGGLTDSTFTLTAPTSILWQRTLR